MAKTQGSSHAVVHRIWTAHGLPPHPEFAPKLRDIVGVYLHPPDKSCDSALQEQLHQDLVVLAAVNHDLPRQAAAFGEAKTAIEGLRVGVGAPHLDQELLVPSFAREGRGCVPQLPADTSPPPGW